MWIAIGVGGLFLVGFIVLLRSDFGKNLQTKTDEQLYRRYSAYLRHSRIALDTDINAWAKTQQELGRMHGEFEQRGYDLDKLLKEEVAAKYEGRQMDFSRGRATETREHQTPKSFNA